MADVQFSTFGGLAIKQIIRSSGVVSVASGGNGSVNVTIPSVNTAKCAINLLTNVAYDSSETGGRIPTTTITLTNSTTMNIAIAGLHNSTITSATIAFQVVEYY